VTVFVRVDHWAPRNAWASTPAKKNPPRAFERSGTAAPRSARLLPADFAPARAGASVTGTTTAASTCSDDYQAEIAFLGMASRRRSCASPECNGCVERFIRTLKEQLLWVRGVPERRGAALRAGGISRALQPTLDRPSAWTTSRPPQARQQLLALGAAA